MDSGENVPPDEKYAVVLRGRHGTGQVTLKWWNRNIGSALFPILFPAGQDEFGNCFYFTIIFMKILYLKVGEFL